MSMLAWLIYYSGGHIYMMAIRAFVVWLRLQRRDWPMHICAGEERWADFFSVATATYVYMWHRQCARSARSRCIKEAPRARALRVL